MSSPNNQANRNALIPWIIALVVLFGLNAPAPIYSRSKKRETSEGIGLAQLADDTLAAGRTHNPLVLLAPPPADGLGFLKPSSFFLSIEAQPELPVIQSLQGTVQGRAPPETPVS